MLLQLKSNGVVIDASEEHAKRLLDNGWAEPGPKKEAAKPARKAKE